MKFLRGIVGKKVKIELGTNTFGESSRCRKNRTK
jgi:hypothetical protein